MIAGMQRLLDALTELETGSNRILRAAIREGQKILEPALSSAALIDMGGPRKVEGHTIQPGGLQASFGSSMKRTSRDGTIDAKTGLGVAKNPAAPFDQVIKGSGKAVKWGHWVILGTDERETGSKRSSRNPKTGKRRRVKTGKPVMRRGRVPAHGFVVRAAAGAESAVEARIMEVAYNGVTKAWRGERGGIE